MHRQQQQSKASPKRNPKQPRGGNCKTDKRTPDKISKRSSKSRANRLTIIYNKQASKQASKAKRRTDRLKQLKRKILNKDGASGLGIFRRILKGRQTKKRHEFNLTPNPETKLWHPQPPPNPMPLKNNHAQPNQVTSPCASNGQATKRGVPGLNLVNMHETWLYACVGGGECLTQA